MSKCQFCKEPCKRPWCPWTLTAVSGLLMALFLGIFNLIASTDDKSEKAVFDKIRKTTVVVWSVDELGRPRSFGTGTVVKNTEFYTYVLTNDHVCGHDPSERKVIEKGILKAEGTVIKANVESDLCLLQLSHMPGESVNLKYKPNQVGERVYLHDHSQIPYGIGQGMFQTAILGETLSGQSGGTDYGHFRLFFEQVYPGASGSGVYSQNNELVGLVSRTFTGKNLSLMVDVESIRAFLAGVKFQ